MPQNGMSPSFSLLKALGLSGDDTVKNPPVLTPEQQNIKDAQVEQWRKEHPIANKIFEYVPGFAEGLLGVNTPTFKDLSEGKGKSDKDTANLVGNLLAAGLPFASIMKEAPVFHGTQKSFQYFEPNRGDANDLLGWMTHFAEDPVYASNFASGHAKGNLQVDMDPDLGPVTNSELNPYLKYGMGVKSKTPNVSPNVIPAKIENKNTLDLLNPNFDDLSQALASLPEKERANVIRNYKVERRNRPTDYSELIKIYNEMGDEERLNQIQASIRGQERVAKDSAANYLKDRVRHVYGRKPEVFQNSPFDAIRYKDFMNNAWAVDPSKVKISTPGGVPLTREGYPSPNAGDIPIRFFGANKGVATAEDYLNDLANNFPNDSDLFDRIFNLVDIK